MPVKQRILTFMLVAAISLLAACGGSSSKTMPPTGTSSTVAIAIMPAPTTTTVPAGSATGISLTAVVSNDTAKNGVDWAVTCSNVDPSGTPQCGYLNICVPGATTCNLHTASGTAVTYFPPAIPYSTSGQIDANETVNITAFATTDHTKNVSTAITVGSYANVLQGNYVFQVKGSDSFPEPYQITGVMTLDGKGNITAAQQTLNTVGLFATSTGTNIGYSAVDTLQGAGGTPSTYFVGPDGRGTITLSLTDPAGDTFQEDFSLVVISSSQALIAEIDAGLSTLPFALAPFAGTGAGTFELQNPTAAATLPSGAYAFVTSGTDSGAPDEVRNGGVPLPLATGMGGVFNIDSPGTISGNGSIADQDYYGPSLNLPKFLNCVPPTGVTGSVSQPSSLGVVTINLTGTGCFGLAAQNTIQFTGYIVDATHIRLIESDDIDGNEGFLTAGIAVAQGTAAGTFTNASLTGPYVFGLLGIDVTPLSFLAYPVPSSFTAAGQMSADGNGNITSGVADLFYPSSSRMIAFVSDLLTGTYTVDPTGRVNVGLVFQSALRPRPNFILYLTGTATPPLVLYAGGEDTSYAGIAGGIAYPQAANASSLFFANGEKYGINFTQQNALLISGLTGENDGTGQVTAQSQSSEWTLTGLADDENGSEFLNYQATAGVAGPPASVPLTNTVSLPPADSFGRVSGTFLTSISASTGGPVPAQYEYYLVNDNQGFFIETDALTQSAPPQVSLGYFTQACDVTSATACQAAASAARKYPLKAHGAEKARVAPKK